MLPLPSNDFIQNDLRACLAEQTDSQQQVDGSNATTSILEASKKHSNLFSTKAEKDAHRRSTETQVAHDLRVAVEVERANLRKSNETESERKLRLSVNAERTKLRRSAETEESRADRLANAARIRKIRAAAAIEKRVLRSHTRVDEMQAQPAPASHGNTEQNPRKRPRSQQLAEDDCVPSTSILDNSELVSIFVRTPAIASTVFLKDLTAQVPRALEINLNDVDENSLNFTFHRSPVRRHEDCEVISLPSEISSTTYGTEYPPPRTAISESLNTATDQSAIQMRLARDCASLICSFTMHNFPACSLQEGQQSPQASKHVRVRAHAQTREKTQKQCRFIPSTSFASKIRKSAKSAHFTRFASKL
ncbi:unnamed protein product [Cylicocyclus nassatus]|uniref:Uncharacterized protein n=1 Tax=Cylicocyclus nassatus TaxID=53992 RepID=A0AA36M6I2_CYLNA|nr:unnamed protein product [Cylicocyclus nassatus]